MIDFESISWIVPKEQDHQSLSESPFSMIPEPIILKIFKKIGEENLNRASSVCHLFHRISYDRTLIVKDVRAAVALLKYLFSIIQEGNTLSGELERLMESKDLLPLKLMKLIKWSEHLLLNLPFDAAVKWSPPVSSHRVQAFTNNTYKQFWNVFIEKNLKEYRSINLNAFFQDWAFDQCLEALIEKKKVPGLLVGELLSKQHVEKLAEAIESGCLEAGQCSFFGAALLEALLQALSASSALKKLSFSMCNLWDADIKKIAQLFQQHESLEEISIKKFAFSLNGIKNLLKMCRLAPSLSVLRLEECSDEELRALVDRHGKSGLRELHLSCLSLSLQTESAIIEKFKEASTVDRFILYYRDYSARFSFERMEKCLKGSFYYRVKERGSHQIEIAKL